MKKIFLSLLALFSLIFAAHNAAAQENLVANGGFETLDPTSTSGALNWLAAGSGGAIANAVYVANVDAYGGINDLVLEGQGTGGAGAGPVALQNNVQPVAGGTLTLSFYAKGALMNGGANPQYAIFWFNAANTQLSGGGFSGFPTPLTTSYGLETVSLTAPSGSAYCQIQFLLAVGAGTSDHWKVEIDNVSLVQNTISGPVILGVPTSNAPTPTQPAGIVQALFNSSGTYPDVSISTWDTTWSSVGSFSNYTIAPTGRSVLNYSGLNYAGVDFGPLNLVNDQTMHVDVWTPNAQNFQLKFANSVYHVTNNMPTNTWVSFDIPLSDFPSLTPLTSVGEFLFVDNDGTTEAGTYYFDNVYFYSNSVVTTPPAGTTNLIVNGGFETNAATTTGLLGWETAGSGGAIGTPVTIDTTAPHSGLQDLSIEGQGTGGAGAGPIVYQSNIPVSAGPVTLSLYAKAAIASGGAAPQYQVIWYNAANVQLAVNGFSAFPVTPGSSYTLETVSMSAPANSDHATLTLLLAVGAGTGDHWLLQIDDVAFLGVPPPSISSVIVDSTSAWQGNMNVFELPENGGGYDFSSGWGTADLDAAFSSSVLTFTPNTSIDRDAPNDPYWWTAPGNNPNKTMDAAMYVQNDSLGGKTVTFSGYCWADTLALPYSTNTTAFIKDFTTGYAVVASSVTNLAPGFFSLTLATTAGDHIQYGFEMIGPDARLTNVANLGSVILASTAPPAGPVITTAPANATVLVGSSITMSVVASGGNLNYEWSKNGIGMADGGNVSGSSTASLTLNNCTGAEEASYIVKVYNVSSSVSATNRLTVLNPSHLTVDPTGIWIGYMNVSELPANGGAYDFGSSWGTADLDAKFSGSVLTFTPNTSIDRDDPSDTTYWWTAAGNNPNKNMDASMYLENDSLAGQTVTFTGYCQANTLVSPYSAATTVFIKDFVADYSSSTSATTTLVPGSAFTVSLATSPGDHVQYGFEMIGPVARIANVANLGKVVISTTPPTITPALSGANGSLSFPTEVGINYTVQYKTNLTDATWQTLTNFSGTGSTQVIPVSANQKSRFFRLSF